MMFDRGKRQQIHWDRTTQTWAPATDRLFGKVGYDEEHGIVVNIDGHQLSMAEFQQTIGVYEGWYFELRFVDPGDVEGPTLPGVQ